MRRALTLFSAVLVGCSGSGGTTGGGGGGGTSAGGGSASGGGSGGGSGIALAGYCDQDLQAWCAFQQRCGEAAPGIDCRKVTQLTRFYLHQALHEDCLWQRRQELDAGTVTYDGQQAARCFASAQTAPCNPSLAFDAVTCSTVFVGKATLGQSCDEFTPCATGLYCDMSTTTCPGSCKAQAADGMTAAGQAACAPGTFFENRPDGGGYCYAPLAAGAACATGFVALQVCAGENFCQNTADGGVACLPLKSAGTPTPIFDLGTCAMSTESTQLTDGGNACETLGHSGDPCGSGYARCQTGLACTGGTCGTIVAQGGACGSDNDCAYGTGCIGGVCTPWGTADAGCMADVFTDDCAPGLFCNSALRCQPQGGAGAACSGNAPCDYDQHLTCDTTQNTCVTASRCQPQ
jgi:hypothetical protein